MKVGLGWDTVVLGINADVVGGCPNENLGADDGGCVAVDGDVPENEKRGAVGFELSNAVAEVDAGRRTAASALAVAEVRPKATGEELEVAPKFGT